MRNLRFDPQTFGGGYFAHREQTNPPKWLLRTRCGGHRCRRSMQALAHMLCLVPSIGSCSQFFLTLQPHRVAAQEMAALTHRHTHTHTHTPNTLRSMSDSTENTAPPKSTKSRNSNSSVRIRTKPKSQFECKLRDTKTSEFLDLVDFGDVAISAETVIGNDSL